MLTFHSRCERRRRAAGPCFLAFGLLAPGLIALSLAGCGDPAQPTTPTASTERHAVYDADGRWIGATPPTKRARPNLIVLVVDTLRHDAVGLPGGPPGLMPYLTSVAKDGVSFRVATAPAPWTVPSMASLLTGLLPSGHGCSAPLQPPRLVDAITTQAEALRATYGYRTAAYTSGPWLGDQTHILQGFTSGMHKFVLQGTTKILADFARGRRAKQPFFLLLHTTEAHDPYGADSHPWPMPPRLPGPLSKLDVTSVTEPWQFTRHFLRDGRERIDLLKTYGSAVTKTVVRYVHSGYRDAPRPALAAELREDYEGGVRWVDGLLRSTVAQLKAWGLLENTILVITADHGEAFGEHGILAHGRQLHDELVSVPLVIRGPGPFRGGRVVGGSVGLIDILPTFFDFAGCAQVQGIHGRSFLPLLTTASPKAAAGRPVFSEEILNRDNTGEDVSTRIISVRTGHWKYIITFDELGGTVMEEAYDLRRDPGERADLCRASGRIDGLTFDPAFCRAVEMARDSIWGAAAGSNRLVRSPYAGGRAKVTSKRPRACGEAASR